MQDASKKVSKPQDDKPESTEKETSENNEEEEQEAKEPEKQSEPESTEEAVEPAPVSLPSPAPPAPPVISAPTPTPANNAAAEANGIDNEDSINLTIGEDEENLLAEEVFINIFLFHKPIKSSPKPNAMIFNRNSKVNSCLLFVFQTETHVRQKGKSSFFINKQLRLDYNLRYTRDYDIRTLIVWLSVSKPKIRCVKTNEVR